MHFSPAGGPGVPMLAASYAAERGLPVVAMLPEFGRWPDAVAVEKRDAELVVLAGLCYGITSTG